MALLMFVALCVALLAGFPAAFTLAGVSLLFALLAASLGLFDLALLAAWPQRMFGAMSNDTLAVIPLFILMGMLLERSRVAEELLETMTRCFGRAPGGLALSVTLVSCLLAASTGIVGATVVTMGLLALPVMLKRGYDPAFSTGSVAAAGTLGQIIPPSIILVILSDQIANAYQKAQLDQGIFSPDTMSVGDLFAGALLPGLLIAALYMAYQLTRAWADPAAAPRLVDEEETPLSPVLIIRALLAPAGLIIAVLGSILAGLAAPSEAAALGAAGAALLAADRLPGGGRILLGVLGSLGGLFLLAWVSDLATPFQVEGWGALAASLIASPAALLALLLFAVLVFHAAHALWLLYQHKILTGAIAPAARMTAMVFAILIGASLFGLVFRGLEGDALVRDALTSLPGGVWTIFICVMVAMFLLGFVLDFLEISFVIVPIVAPILLELGMNPIWLGVMMAINLQTSFLTPPFGFALFYLRGVAPASVPTRAIWRGVVPFIVLHGVALVLLALFPSIATWLPHWLSS